MDTFHQVLLKFLDPLLTITNRAKKEKHSVCAKMMEKYLFKALIIRLQFCHQHRSVVIAISRRTHKFQCRRHPFGNTSCKLNVMGPSSPWQIENCLSVSALWSHEWSHFNGKMPSKNTRCSQVFSVIFPVEMASFMFLSQYRDTKVIFYLLYKITESSWCHPYLCTLIQNENGVSRVSILWEKTRLVQSKWAYDAFYFTVLYI